MSSNGACDNCTGTDYIFDYRTGDVVCQQCGMVESGRLTVHSGGAKGFVGQQNAYSSDAIVSESAPHGAVAISFNDAKFANARFRTNSPPYQRRTYFSERISQWVLSEPEIEAKDMQIIRDKFDELTGKFVVEYGEFSNTEHNIAMQSKQRWGRNHLLTKDSCRTLLWCVDEDNKRIGNGRTFFVKRYLVSLFFNFLELKAFSLSICCLI